MFGINKNGTKHKIGIIMPASYPASRITRESVSVTADGVKTWSQLIDELYSLADISKVENYSVLKLNWSANGYGLYYFVGKNSGIYQFTFTITEANSIQVNSCLLSQSGSKFITSSNGTRSDISSTVATSGYKLTLYY